jgi:hypothetical protein
MRMRKLNRRRLGHFLVLGYWFYGYFSIMFVQLLKALFQTYTCQACRQQKATRGFFCMYCSLDQRLTQTHPTSSQSFKSQLEA